MTKRPPHILVTTPESLYILLTSEGGRGDARRRRARSSSTRSTRSCATSAARTSRCRSSGWRRCAGARCSASGSRRRRSRSSEVGAFLAGAGRECALVDAGTFRELDLAVEVPPSPLATVCSHEQWDEIYARIAELVARAPHDARVREHAQAGRAHRGAAREAAGRGRGHEPPRQPLARAPARRGAAAQGRLAARARRDGVARARHRHRRRRPRGAGRRDAVDRDAAAARRPRRATRSARVPKGRIFPLTLDELVEAAALLRCVRARRCSTARRSRRGRSTSSRSRSSRRAWPKPCDEDDALRALPRAPGRTATSRARTSTRSSRCTRRTAAARCSTATASNRRAARDEARAHRPRCTSAARSRTPPTTRSCSSPRARSSARVNEDFAIESNGGDIFQLGNTSWRILRVEPGDRARRRREGRSRRRSRSGSARARRARASCRARSRTSASVRGRGRPAEAEAPGVAGRSRTCASLRRGFGEPAATPARRVRAGRPTRARLRADRSGASCSSASSTRAGGMQLVVHAPFGCAHQPRAGASRCASASASASASSCRRPPTRRRSCCSLGPQHSFPLEEVFDYLHPTTARDVLVQALLPAPMFGTRWRWNAQRSLLLERTRNGKRVPAPLLRMRAEDLLARRVPARRSRAPRRCRAVRSRCPTDHPIVRQTIEDCLHEAMDVDGFLEVLRGLADGTIEQLAIDTPEPSAFARGILTAQPYTFLDDAPLEERRTQAVLTRRDPRRRAPPTSSARSTPTRSRACARRPGREPESVEEVHEALLWMGYVTDAEVARAGGRGSTSSSRRGRVVRDGDRWFAVEATRDPKAVLRGRLEALGPVFVASGLRRRGAAAAARVRGRRRCARASTAGRPGATGVCSRASSATRSTGCAARSSR